MSVFQRAMMFSTPLWIPSLMYGAATLLMLVVSIRDWKRARKEYERGYAAGAAAYASSKITFSVSSTDASVTAWIEPVDDTIVH